MEKIISKNNDKIKNAVKLCTSSRYRKSMGMFIIEGTRLCYDAAISGINIKEFFVTFGALNKYEKEVNYIVDKSETVYEITDEISQKISDTNSPQGLFCICEISEAIKNIDTLKNDGKYIAMENIQDPINLGAICRTAEALGIDGAIICSGCDIYNPKVLRASMGSLFRLPIFKVEDIKNLFSQAREKNILTLTTITDKNAKHINNIIYDGGVICIIGNEGNGVTRETIESCDECVTIPMKGRTQSLNASMAACITMWEMLR